MKNDYIHDYRSRSQHHVIGVMSGTSLDGVDAVLVSISNDAAGNVTAVRLEDMVSIPYTAEMTKKINDLCMPGHATIADVNLAHAGLAHWNAAAVNRLVDQCGMPRSSIDAVGMHGQTVWHAPVPSSFPGPDGTAVEVTGTLQLGNAQVVSVLTGLPVVSDFRSADMAVGGEGAPLAPFIDFMLFGDPASGVAVQNIGGIGNVTVLPSHGTASNVFAFDTGPGNMIIDAVVRWGTEGRLNYDDSGAIAAIGHTDEALLVSMLDDPYFKKRPPKSTGREVYGTEYAKHFIQHAADLGLKFEDMVATATAFTASTIAQAYQDFVLPVTPLHRVIVSGGGARNKTLLAMLERMLPWDVEVSASDKYGIPDQAREAMAFALMAHESVMGKCGNLPAVTGARQPMVLGTITMQQL